METKDFVLGYGAGKNSAVSEKIVEEVDAWLDEHITNPDSPPLDRSLTSSSAAAPADMVGDINDEVGNLKNTLNHKADVIYDTASGDIASFPDGADGLPLKGMTVAIEPVQAGTGDPSPTNVRPISGWTGANVTRTGKNILGNTGESRTSGGVTFTVNNDGTIDLSGTATRDTWFRDSTGQIDDYVPAGTYHLSGGISSLLKLYLVGSFIDGSGISSGFEDTGSGKTVVLSKDAYIHYQVYVGNGVNTTGITIKPMLELGSTASEYEPYSGTTLPISWQSSAGTVYGGTLDVTTGVLTVMDANIASYNGETLPGEWISDRDVYAAGTTPTTGAQVVFKLATPQTYQLDPVTVTTLLGQNNIWADCGPSTVEYPANTKLYIDRKLAALVAALS